MNSLFAYFVFILTIILALVQPSIKNFKITHAWSSIFGSFLIVFFQIVSFGDIRESFNILSRPLITIISLMVITLIADKSGIFDYIAFYLARIAQGDGRKLFTYLFIAGVLTGIFFTNDSVVLIFVPLIYRLIGQIGHNWTVEEKISYYFGVLFIANLVGGLVISNPINMIVAQFFDIGFLEYAKWMALPALTSMIVSYLFLRFSFRKSIPKLYDCSKCFLPHDGQKNKFMIINACVMFLVLIGFFIGHVFKIETWFVALVGAVLLMFLFGVVEKNNNREILKHVGWDAIIFVVGIFIIVSGLRNVGLTNYLGKILTVFGVENITTLTMTGGFVSGISSSMMNNHPTAYSMALTTKDLNFSSKFKEKMFVFSNLIGGDLGPKMLPIGSLAALLWFRILRSKGIYVSYKRYIQIGVPATLFAIFFSVLVLNFQIYLFGI